MSKRRKRCESCKVLTDYREAHHIVPVSLGGSDEKSNIIRLCIDCHGKIHNVQFNKKEGLVSKGIQKSIDRNKFFHSFDSDVWIKFLFDLQDADEDYYNFIHGGLMTGIISSSDLVRIVFPEHRLRKAVRINIPHRLMHLCNEIFTDELEERA
tara:strand:- start:916 stop:1374 length:459 start_codon:yes stop_codon:yes gene_type:complete